MKLKIVAVIINAYLLVPSTSFAQYKTARDIAAPMMILDALQNSCKGTIKVNTKAITDVETSFLKEGQFLFGGDYFSSVSDQERINIAKEIDKKTPFVWCNETRGALIQRGSRYLFE